MKRKPEKHYKRPKYAAGLAALLFAGGLTGCTETAGDVQIDGGMDVPADTTESEVQLQGDVAEWEESLQPVMTEEETTEEVLLDGDIVIEPEETCTIETATETTETTTSAEGGWVEVKPVLAGDIAVE